MSVFDLVVAPFAVLGVLAIAGIIIAWRYWQQYGNGVSGGH